MLNDSLTTKNSAMAMAFARQPYRLSVGGLAGRDISYNKPIKTRYAQLIITPIKINQ